MHTYPDVCLSGYSRNLFLLLTPLRTVHPCVDTMKTDFAARADKHRDPICNVRSTVTRGAHRWRLPCGGSSWIVLEGNHEKC